jgi:uncharacterized glyoxalase superfamily protein PhnB
MATLTRLAPELPAANLAASLAYYRDQLGFEIRTILPDRSYAIVERDGLAIHLFLQAAGEGAGLHLFTDGIEALHEELRDRGALQAIERKPWGNRDFRVADPAGNKLKFTESTGS